jgi:hypothetical protein
VWLALTAVVSLIIAAPAVAGPVTLPTDQPVLWWTPDAPAAAVKLTSDRVYVAGDFQSASPRFFGGALLDATGKATRLGDGHLSTITAAAAGGDGSWYVAVENDGVRRIAPPRARQRTWSCCVRVREPQPSAAVTSSRPAPGGRARHGERAPSATACDWTELGSVPVR